MLNFNSNSDKDLIGNGIIAYFTPKPIFVKPIQKMSTLH